MKNVFHDSIKALRFLSIDMVENANSGHPGLPLGMADVTSILFQEFLNFNPQDPKWENRDRFILSAGHGSALLYSLLHLTGYESLTIEELKKFRKLGSLTPGHPEYGHTEGIEATTGPLGQGLAMAVGMAIAQKKREAEIGAELCCHKIYVLVSDGDLMEGISHEALSLAGHLGLSNLIVLFDDNGITIDGSTNLACSDDTLKRLQSYQFETLSIDGHDHNAIRDALKNAQTHNKPTFIACKTIIGFGAPSKSGTSTCHGSPLGDLEISKMREELSWPHPPFEIPVEIYEYWKKAANRNQTAYFAFQEKINQASPEIIDLLKVPLLPSSNFFVDLKQSLYDTYLEKSLATRVAFQKVLEATVKETPSLLIGGSADLTPSNNTKVKTHNTIHKNDFKGNYLHFGIREHAMGAILNGISLYGEGTLIPFGGTFLVFSDYMRPAIRLSALMKKQVLYVLTHDSIGLGEDGPTHQPIEHLSSLRAIPGLYVMRPCDIIEMTECFEVALHLKENPSVFALSRQNLPLMRENSTLHQNLSSKGAYILKDTQQQQPNVTLIATGSEVHLAINSAHKLEALHQNLHVRVVSMPCMELFEEQNMTYKKSVLGDAPIIAIEAACEMGWGKYYNHFNSQSIQGTFIGMTTGFGASASLEEIFKEFDITEERIIQIIEERILNK